MIKKEKFVPSWKRRGPGRRHVLAGGPLAKRHGHFGKRHKRVGGGGGGSTAPVEVPAEADGLREYNTILLTCYWDPYGPEEGGPALLAPPEAAVEAAAKAISVDPASVLTVVNQVNEVLVNCPPELVPNPLLLMIGVLGLVIIPLLLVACVLYCLYSAKKKAVDAEREQWLAEVDTLLDTLNKNADGSERAVVWYMGTEALYLLAPLPPPGPSSPAGVVLTMPPGAIEMGRVHQHSRGDSARVVPQGKPFFGRICGGEEGPPPQYQPDHPNPYND